MLLLFFLGTCSKCSHRFIFLIGGKIELGFFGWLVFCCCCFSTNQKQNPEPNDSFLLLLKAVGSDQGQQEEDYNQPIYSKCRAIHGARHVNFEPLVFSLTSQSKITFIFTARFFCPDFFSGISCRRSHGISWMYCGYFWEGMSQYVGLLQVFFFQNSFFPTVDSPGKDILF